MCIRPAESWARAEASERWSRRSMCIRPAES
jgi:hypothetical protein